MWLFVVYSALKVKANYLLKGLCPLIFVTQREKLKKECIGELICSHLHLIASTHTVV